MFKRIILATLIIFVTVTMLGCSGSENSVRSRADDRPDPTIVGEWVYFESLDYREEWIFLNDGSFTVIEDKRGDVSSVTGSYRIENRSGDLLVFLDYSSEDKKEFRILTDEINYKSIKAAQEDLYNRYNEKFSGGIDGYEYGGFFSVSDGFMYIISAYDEEILVSKETIDSSAPVDPTGIWVYLSQENIFVFRADGTGEVRDCDDYENDVEEIKYEYNEQTGELTIFYKDGDEYEHELNPWTFTGNLMLSDGNEYVCAKISDDPAE